MCGSLWRKEKKLTGVGGEKRGNLKVKRGRGEEGKRAKEGD